MALSKRLAQVGRECVACGTCEKACPREAIRVACGVAARVDGELCVGCGKCAKVCPADVIVLIERRAGA
ncbi:MAG: 4Fe-4S binding protein [Oscillibacter sp.]|jgi:ferredoxin|uniref:ATP-binding protein n=1 Tax=uncultured Oscillibacter sp. TaxID=876091 RepID=UPI002171C8E8|nr:4Fe-4S binding protein [uncultured Oscillibacter sp.]MCI9643400.1 4Fe-4S binding protein [Oscillibacter sp.]